MLNISRGLAALTPALLLAASAAFTGAEAQSAVKVTIDPAKRVGESRLTLGVTHTQYTPLEGHGDPGAVAAAQALLPKMGKFQNQHIMGWGALNPQPAPDVYDWSTLDRRLELIRKTGGTPVITLCCAPDWMKGGQVGQTDWSQLEEAPLPQHFDDFARLAATVARRYPDVRHYQVWNEFKGFWNRSENRWDYEGYTTLYNKVYQALKAVNPDIQVGGPYVPFRPDAVDPGRIPAKDPTLRDQPYGSVDQRTLDAFEYWNKHKAGADFITNDLGSYNHKRPPSDPFAATRLYSDMTKWLRDRTQLPIWWAEWYATSYTYPTFTPEQQNALLGVTLMRLVRSGADVALRWAPQGEAAKCCAGSQESLWSDVRQPGGGKPFPFARTTQTFHEHFQPGTPLVHAQSSSPSVAVLATPKLLLLINTTDKAQGVSINGAPNTYVRPYEVKTMELPGAAGSR